MAETSSLNCLLSRVPYQCLHSLNAWNPFSEKALLFTDFCFVPSPSQNSVPNLSVPRYLALWGFGQDRVFPEWILVVKKLSRSVGGIFDGFFLLVFLRKRAKKSTKKSSEKSKRQNPWLISGQGCHWVLGNPRNNSIEKSRKKHKHQTPWLISGKN